MITCQLAPRHALNTGEWHWLPPTPKLCFIFSTGARCFGGLSTPFGYSLWTFRGGWVAGPGRLWHYNRDKGGSSTSSLCSTQRRSYKPETAGCCWLEVGKSIVFKRVFTHSMQKKASYSFTSCTVTWAWPLHVNRTRCKNPEAVELTIPF